LSGLASIGELVKGYNTPVYVVLHTATRHLWGLGTWQLDMDADIPDSLKRDNVTFLVGDIHVRDTRKMGFTVHSSGPLYPTRASEMDRECCVTHVTSGGLVDIPCDVRLYSNAGRVGAADVSTVLDAVLEESTSSGYELPPYVRMEITEPDVRISDEYREKCIVDMRGADADDTDVPDAEAPAAMSLDDAIRAETSDEMLGDMAVKLIHCDDPVAEIQRWFDFWGVLLNG